MATKQGRVRFPDNLDAHDVNVLVRGLKQFLETCRLTAESDLYLKYNAEFAGALEKL